MRLSKGIFSGVYPQMLITKFKVYIPINITQIPRHLDNDEEYIEYLYDEEEYEIEEYIYGIKNENKNLKEIQDKHQFQIQEQIEVVDLILTEIIPSMAETKV